MAGARLRQKEKTRKRRSVPLLILKALYWLLFALSALVLVLYIHFTRPPDTPRPDRAEPTAAVSDDPQTPEDESQQTPGPDAPEGRQYKDDCYTFLVMGMDAGNGNTDTMMVVTYDVGNQHVGVVSVPRDTLMDVPRTVKKINAA